MSPYSTERKRGVILTDQKEKDALSRQLRDKKQWILLGGGGNTVMGMDSPLRREAVGFTSEAGAQAQGQPQTWHKTSSTHGAMCIGIQAWKKEYLPELMTCDK